MKSNYLVQAWLVLALALLFGASLAGVQAALSDRIESNKLAETLQQIPALVPGAAGGQPLELDGRVVYRATDTDGKQIGWVVPASGQGVADAIEILIGLDSQADTLTGLYVLSQKETPGLGSKITGADWLGQFAGKATNQPLAVVKTDPSAGDQVLSVTGATISSVSVTDICNATVARLGDKLAAAAN